MKISKQFSSGEICTYPDVNIDVGGIPISFHDLAIKGWKFRARRKYANAGIKIVLWKDKTFYSRGGMISLKIKGSQPDLLGGTDYNEENSRVYDWPKFFESLRHEMVFAENTANLTYTAARYMQTKKLPDYSKEELLAELAERYLKPKRKKTVDARPSNVVYIQSMLDQIQLEIDEERTAA